MIIRNNWSICILQLEIRRKFVLVSIHRCIGLSKSICIFACLFMSQGVFIQSFKSLYRYAKLFDSYPSLKEGVFDILDL